MAKKPKLVRISIHPAKNGGHNVRHEFASQPSFSKGPMTGGVSMASPAPEEYNFGPSDHASLLKHIAGALALKGLEGNRGPGNSAADDAGYD